MTAVEPGDIVSCSFAGEERKGIYITERDGFAVVKLNSGYNIGIPFPSCKFVERLPAVIPKAVEVQQHPDLPELSIISTGGTIASRIDYRTGAVTSQFNAEDILRAIPGLAGIGRYRAVQLYQILSENMTPTIWQELARAVYKEISSGAKGILVTHGTDTMSYSAAAISFMVETPVPIVFVGSQRSADRPSSDNAMNALCSAQVATGDLGEVAVVMHATTNDDKCAIHRGTRVRKMHTSRRDAFQSIGMLPLGYVDYPSLEVSLDAETIRRGQKKLAIHDRLEERCGLVQFHPGMVPETLRAFEGYRGLVIAGTGLGHVSTQWIPALKSLIDAGSEIVMTSQCLNGRVCDRVYDTGRDLLNIGVIEGADMLPEVALVKLMWVLANASGREEVREMMSRNLRGECMRRSAHGL